MMGPISSASAVNLERATGLARRLNPGLLLALSEMAVVGLEDTILVARAI